MDEYQTDILFRDTQQRRAERKGRRLLMEKAKDAAPTYALVRKKGASRERSKSRGRLAEIFRR
jgi:hypothetical protein